MSLMRHQSPNWNLSETGVVVSAGGTFTLAPADPDRWIVAFTIQSGSLFVSTDKTLLGLANSGIVVLANQGPRIFTYRDWGQFVNVAWYGRATAGTSIVTVHQGSIPR